MHLAEQCGFYPTSWIFNAPDAFEAPPKRNPYCENERGLGPAEMAAAILRSGPTFRTSKELGLHVLEVLQGMLTSGKNGNFCSMKTKCGIPEAFYE